MLMFFETSDSKYVNLKEVTSIAFEEFKDRFDTPKYKVIFNMNYAVTLKGSNKLISDYIYSIYENYTEFKDVFDYLMNLIDEYQWIKLKEPRIINPYHISFLTQDPNKNRIIINLASTVSFHGNNTAFTSDFVYINCDNKDEYQDKLTSIREALENLILY